MKQIIAEWIGAIAAAFLSFMGVRSAYILFLKEMSVGKAALKKRDAKIEALENKVTLLESRDKEKEMQIKYLQRDSDERYEDMQNIDDKVETIGKELRKSSL